MKKIVSLVLVLTMVLASFSGVNKAYADTIFSDVNINDWFYNDLVEAVEKGIVEGYSDGTFKPNKVLTVAEFIKMLVAAVHGEEGIIERKDSAWYDPWFVMAENKEIITNDKLLARPNAEVLRKEVAVAVYEMFKNTDFEELVEITTDEVYYIIERKLKDVNNYMYEVATLAKMGIFIGNTDKKFKLESGFTRAQAMTIILRILDKDKRQPMETSFSYDSSELAVPEVKFYDNATGGSLFEIQLTNYDDYSDSAEIKVELPNNPELCKSEKGPVWHTEEYYGMWEPMSHDNYTRIFVISTSKALAESYKEYQEKLEKIKAGYELNIVVTVRDTINGKLVEKQLVINKVLTFKGSINVRIVR